MKHPCNQGEYDALYNERFRISGYGIDVTNHFPCPFCTEPEWMVARVLELQEVMTHDHACAHCGRSARFIVESAPGSTHFELVQTGGEDAPDWLSPTPRRIDAAH